MKLKEIRDILKAEVLYGENHLEDEIELAGASDLMSDVLTLATPGMLLITGLVNPQVIRTAVMVDMKAVVIVRGKVPPPQTVELARRYDIALLRTDMKMYKACGELYSKGLKGLD